MEFAVHGCWTRRRLGGKRNSSTGPTRVAQLCSLCSPPSASRYIRSSPTTQPFLDQRIAQQARVGDDVLALARARRRARCAAASLCGSASTSRRITRSSHQTDGDSTASLPNAVGYRKPEVHREQAAERRAAHGRVRGAGKGLVRRVDERLELLDEHAAVVVGVAAAALVGARRRRVLVDAVLAGVVDAHDDDRLDRAAR